MTILTRVVAVAALISVALSPVAATPATPAELYGDALQRARAVHHERAAGINANIAAETEERATSDLVTRSTHKKGIAFSGSKSQLNQYLVHHNIKFIYNWGATPIKKSGILSCSMLWGEKNLGAFRKARSDYDCLMGPNEFNLAAQAGLSVSRVHTLWQNEILNHGKGKTLISPSVTTAKSGLPDMKELIKKCGGNCHWHAASFHYYGKKAEDLIAWAKKLHAATGSKVWITEWACYSFVNVKGGKKCTKSEVWNMMRDVIKFAEETSWIDGYAPYGFSTRSGVVYDGNRLMSTGGKITPLGKLFIGS